MNEFSKLNRDQMRKITGGTPPTCNLESGCIFRYPEDHPFYHPGEVLFGICYDTLEAGCQCVRDYIGNPEYSTNPNQCYEIIES